MTDFAKNVKITEISIIDYSWNGSSKNQNQEIETETEIKPEIDDPNFAQEMNNFLSKSGLKLDKDANFNLERILSENDENTDQNFEQFWKPKKIKGSESDPSKLFWEFGRYSEFIGENGRKSWFDLPFRCDGENGNQDPRTEFRANHGY